MGRKSSGLRNRFRSGKSTYTVQGKARRKDHYGSYSAGVLRSPENVAGNTINAQLRAGQRETA